MRYKLSAFNIFHKDSSLGLKNRKLLQIEQFFGLRVMVLKVVPFLIDAELMLSPLEEVSAKPID
jgi:hypothetical protein